MSDHITEQETFWAGEFGNAYTQRNRSETLLSANVVLFSKILSCMDKIESAIEFGANVGMNLLALRGIMPSLRLAAIEINAAAVEELRKISDIEIYHSSIFDTKLSATYDFAFTKGVLIHIAPERLPEAYDLLYQASRRYLCVAEYYNPTPVELPYRGHRGKLFKRDFAGEMLDRFPDLKLIDYGFVYHRGPFPQDDISWFLLEKKGC